MRRKVSLICVTFWWRSEWLRLPVFAQFRKPRRKLSTRCSTSGRLSHLFLRSCREASRFDRSGTGLSRLAGLVELLGADLYTLEWRNGIRLTPSGRDRRATADLPPSISLVVVLLQEGGCMLLLADPVVGLSKAFKAKSDIPVMWMIWGCAGVRMCSH